MSEEKQESSEVKDDGLAKDALEATADTSADEPEQTVPLHKHTALRTRAQEAEVGRARAEGELAAVKAQQAQDAPAVKSPIDLEIERQAALGITEEEVVITPALYRKQQNYDKQVANQAAQTKATQELGARQLASVKKASAAHSDFQQIVKTGEVFLSEGELFDIGKAGDDFGELAYAKCAAALAANKPEAESKSKTGTAPEKKQSESEAETVPTQSEILKGLNVDPSVEAAAQM